MLSDVSAPAVIQIFESTYDNLEQRTIDIFNAGYGGIWIPPTGRADSGNQSVGYDVFDRFDLGKPGASTLYGTETGLKTSVDVLQEAGLNVFVDFVLNHNGFSDLNNQAFVDAGGYPGFAITLNTGNNSQGIDDIDGDFHGSFESGDLKGRLAGLIDINQGKNYQFIRHPVDANNPQNIPAGTVNNVANPDNARFYPDTSLSPIMLFDPKTGESNIAVYPFNTANPLAGDATTENALGLMMRNAQWLVQEVGVDGFRLDAVKHFEDYVLEFFDRAVYRSKQQTLLDGSTKHIFSFSEVFDGDKAFQQTKIRKDIDPNDPGRIGGNRDVLDFPLAFAMNANLTGNGFTNDWRNIKNASQDVQDDGFANNGSQGVAFVNSHDEHGPHLENVAHAFVLMRPGNAAVYFNAEEFGQGRDFPKDGRGDALGGLYGDAITTLVNIRNTHGRGDYIDRTPTADEKEMLIFERSASAVTLLSNRTDGGFDSRTIQTNFLPGTPLVELTGNAANPTIDPFNDFPEVVVVNADGTINVKVPRNTSPNGVQHNSGYLIYGVSGTQGNLTITNAGGGILSGGSPTALTNGTIRLSDLQVITNNTFEVNLATNIVNHLGSIRDQFADGDNALLRFDGGIDINGNGVVDFTAPGGTSYGFEEFLTFKQPGYFESSGNGLYSQSIDATALSEGQHFIEVRGFRHREPGEGDAIYSTYKQGIYVDRLAPISEVVSFDPIVSGQNENRRLQIKSTDLTADNVHVFLDLPASLTDAQVISMVGSGSQTNKVDRDLFEKDFNGLSKGNHVVTVVTYEISGNVNVQRFPGLFTESIFGSGLGDLDTDGDVDATDISLFETVLQSNNSQFDAAADFNGDGLVNVADVTLFHQQLLSTNATPFVQTEFDSMVIANVAVDYGDAPANYPTLQIDGGAHHIIAGPLLGSAIDPDGDGSPSSTANGDDLASVDDEDGVMLPSQIAVGQSITLTVVATSDGLLNGFIDLNADGDFDDANEQFATDLVLSEGTNSVSLTVPAGASVASTFVRFRFGTYSDVGPTGLASDGEVEDYVVDLVPASPSIIVDGMVINNGSNNRSGINTIGFEFDQNVTSQNTSPFRLFNHTSQQLIDLSLLALSGQGTSILVWNLFPLMLDNGRYTFEFQANQIDGIASPVGRPASYQFHVLAGDLNGDARVNFDDLSIIGGNLDPIAGMAWREGDANGDGFVNFDDISIVGENLDPIGLPPLEFDFGDVEDASSGYATSLVKNGARHALGSGLMLGVSIDSESDGQPTANADGDDLSGANDEDGIAAMSMIAGQMTNFTLNATVPAGFNPVLNAWIDFNNDGDWDDPGEQIFTDHAISNGDNFLSFAVPASANLGNVSMRFRLTGSTGYSHTGLAADGEVEDYVFAIASPPSNIVGDSVTVQPFIQVEATNFNVTQSQGKYLERLLQRWNTRFSENVSEERKQRIIVRRLNRVSARLERSAERLASKGRHDRATHRAELASVVGDLAQETARELSESSGDVG